ncbi:hypothetical protein KXW60_003561 [Aspergillus fumigatus]|nr:hypothetical protein KXW60_003561 [Aspergillus fumigatus]
MDNLLCRDKNNHPNGSLTVFPDGHSYNYTGLYYTPSCQDKSYKGSVLMRLDDSYRGQYIWAYNAALTEYCCHNDEAGLGQADCCDGGTFELPAPGSGSSSASASASASTSTPCPVGVWYAFNYGSDSEPVYGRKKARIGIGAAGAGIIIIVLVALLLRARRLAAVNRGPSQTEKNTFWASGARTRATQAELEACADAPPSELSAKPAPNRFELAS